MNEMASAQFRKQYAKLTKRTDVTVNGHIIGTWLPVHQIGDPWPDGEVLPAKDVQRIGSAQQGRDELLRKINRGT